jgi:alkanesulfonate monooxygenase SsuD/methylene tetrahydromethanopterin reductase-like flavin-dependent oxidoreductase (luciferase family)
VSESLELQIVPEATGWTFDDVREVVQEAERLGFTSAWFSDNVRPPFAATDELEPWSELPWDAWTLLSALAAVTKKIRLGPLVTPAPRRHPAVLANAAACLDRISNGRLNVGMGVGDDLAQFAQWGLPHPGVGREGIALLREHLEVLRRAWTESPANFEGQYYRLDQAFSTRPVQEPHPPIWIGIVHGTKVLPRVAAEHAAGLVVFSADHRVADEAVKATAEACAELGRRPVSVARWVRLVLTDAPAKDEARRHPSPVVLASPGEASSELRRWTTDLGIDTLVLRFAAPGQPKTTGAAFIESMRLFVDEVAPALRSR